ncbi:MAG: OmpA family protein [Deltaproteobacteria bacterium]|nr:OmpA family protein [Deltaproteobacteria bacterium]
MNAPTLLRLGALTVLSVLALEGTGRAQAQVQSTRVLIEHFEPLPGQGMNTLNIHGSEVTPRRKVTASLFMGLVDDLLTQASGSALVHRQLSAQLGVSIGLLDWLEVSFGLPLLLAQDGADLASFGMPGESLSGFAVGDIRITPKVRLLDPAKAHGFGVALAMSLWAPTGSTPFNSDDATRARPTLIADWRHASGWKIGFNLGYTLRARRQISNFVSDDTVDWGVALETPTGLDSLRLLATVYGEQQTVDDRGGSPPFTQPVSGSDSSAAELDMGVRYSPVPALALTAGGGMGLTGSVRSPDWRVFLGIAYATGGADRDQDGVADTDDGCPDVAEDADGFEDADGCPDPDNDKDGIADGQDKCPDEAEDQDGFEDADGCPDTDNDQDGVADTADKCPDDPEDADDFQDGDGCPDPDNDGDGVLDSADACPTAAEDIDGFEDADGCPDPDNDGDGILDKDDLCPGQAENVDGVEDEDGCPERAGQKVKMSKGRILILDKVFFAPGKAVIKKQSFGLLEEVAQTLVDNPQITKLRVEGHTDSQGADADNQRLSAERAQSVRDFLLAHGVDAVRLIATGYGETKPVASNGNAKGRAANRRVEFTILTVNGQPVEGAE